MLNFKQEIASYIAKVVEMDSKEIQDFIEIPKDTKLGDYAFPCFRLAKALKKAPPAIASELKEKIIVNPDIIEKVEIVGGYLNFYQNKKCGSKK